MDAASGKVAPLFDQARLAAALGKVTGKPVDANKLPVTGYAADAGWPRRCRGAQQALPVRPRRRRGQLRRSCHAGEDRQGAGRAVAGQEERGVHPRLEPVAARRRQRPGNPAHHRRRGELRLRHRQRRLETHRQRDRRVVAGFEADRHLPAGPAQDRRDVPGQHQCRPSEAGEVEISAGRRQGRDDDRARHHRRRREEGAAPADAAGPASFHPVRRRQLRPRWRLG